MRKLSFSLVFISFLTLPVLAQNSFLQLLRQKTENDLQRIITASPSVLGYMALDLTTGESFAFNENLVFPQGSAIKIPVLMEVYKQARQGKFALTDLRKVEKTDIVGGTGVLKDLTDPAALSIRNLGVLMIVLSDNSATNSLIELVGMNSINATMESLGLKNTKVQRRMINQAASARGEENISTPAEAVKILKMLYDGKFIDKSASAEIIEILKRNDRSNGNSRLAAGFPASVPLAFKPGVIDGVSTEWAIVFLSGRPYALAIMQNYMDKSVNDRTMEEISSVLYQYFWRIGNASRYGTYVDPELIR